VSLVISAPLTHGGVARPVVFVFGTLGVLVVAAQTGVIAGSLAKSLDHVYAMESIILLPLGFLGGIFYSVRQLPYVWGRREPDQSGLLAGSGRANRSGGGAVTSSAVSALAVVWALATGPFRSGRRPIFGTKPPQGLVTAGPVVEVVALHQIVEESRLRWLPTQQLLG